MFEPSTVGGYYEPLDMISLMLDYAMTGRADMRLEYAMGEPLPTLRPFHRTSLLLHVLNSLLVSLLVLLLFRNPWVAALAGLLFGVHPLTVEPIPWVGQRKTLLAAFFSLCCLCLYVLYATRAGNAKGRKRWRWPYLGSLATYALALLSKPTSLSVVALVFVLDFWPLRRLGRNTLVEKIPFFVLAGLSAIVASISQKRTSTFVILDTYSRVKTALVLCHNHIFYLAKMLWPADLSLFYPYPEPLSLENPVVLAGVVGTALLIPVLLASLRWTRALLAGWAFFFLATLPTLGVVGATETVAADRYAYLPLIGLVLVVAWLLARLWSARAGTWRPWLLAAALVVIGGECVATRAQLAPWRDSEALFRDMLADAPGVPRLHYELGNALRQKGRMQEAMREYRQALGRSPYFPYECPPEIAASAHNNLAILLARQGDLSGAVEHWRAALEAKPGNANTHHNLGIALTDRGQGVEAMRHFTEALRLDPGNAVTHVYLGRLLAQAGRSQEAREHLERALRLRPDLPMAREELARLADGEPAKASASDLQRLLEDVRTHPDDVDALGRLGAYLESAGNYTGAIAQYRQILRLDPQHEQALVRLRVVEEKARRESDPP
ncbi:MAG: tetratricopeptide repeat protein [Deltaproteobacteria bacterium]|nr:tetratricopeptide repeat protein [Deltaproteobacteria bacterium]